jgi:hypothetical protein
MSGTFDAGLSALNMKVPLFVLEPELLKPTPPRGNYDLIKLGGISLSNGAELIQYLEKLNDGKVATDIVPQNEYNKVKQEETNTLNEPIVEFENIETKILKALNGSPLSAKDILTKSKLDWTTKKLTPYLKKIEGIVTIKRGRENLYTLKENFTKTPTLF